jgi:tetratricopeptide (TPR) repeat protein
MVSRSLTFIAPIAALAISVGSSVAQQAAAPECRHLDYRSNFRLNGVQQHLTQARATKYDDVRANRIADATRVLGDAQRAGGVDQPTLWYMYAQLYVLKHDLVGADSSFSKVEAATDPECKREILRERRNEWVPLQNAGVELLNGGNVDSALVMFRKAGTIYRAEPYAFLNMASIFVGKNLDDSAVAYFRLAARSSQDRRFDEARETALFNAARLVHRSALDTVSVHAEAQRRSVPDSVVKTARLKDAESAYREVLQLRPRDLPAQASLAGVLVMLRRETEARVVYDSMLAHTDSMDAFDLIDAGTALFRQARYDLAARATEAGLAKDRCFRDGMYNLANIYLAAKDTVKLLEVSRRLVAQDSMNRASLQMLARAWQDHGDKDSTLRVLQRAEALPWEIAAVRFEPGDSSAALHAMVTNLQQQTHKGFTLTVQFVNGSCDVVASQNVDLPDLNANGTAGQAYDFTVTGSGRGIVAWKYKTN